MDYGNPTRLFDAIEASIDSCKRVKGRRVVLVFTDGDDTASKIGMGKVLDRARADEAMIYSIGLRACTSTASGRCGRARTEGCGSSQMKPAAATSS